MELLHSKPTLLRLMKALYFPRTENLSNPWYIPVWLWDRMSEENKAKFIFNRKKHKSCLVLLTENAPVVRPKWRLRVQRNGNYTIVGYAQNTSQLRDLLALYATSSTRVESFDTTTSRWGRSVETI